MSKRLSNIWIISLALMVLSAHILPNSMCLLDAEVWNTVSINFNEVEEEKRLDKIGHEQVAFVPVFDSSFEGFITCFEEILHHHHMEIPSPPPDLS